MHNKVLVADDHTVATGSYNFFEHPQAVDENLLVINTTDIVAAFSCKYTIFDDCGYKLEQRDLTNKLTQNQKNFRVILKFHPKLFQV